MHFTFFPAQQTCLLILFVCKLHAAIPKGGKRSFTLHGKRQTKHVVCDTQTVEQGLIDENQGARQNRACLKMDKKFPIHPMCLPNTEADVMQARQCYTEGGATPTDTPFQLKGSNPLTTYIKPKLIPTQSCIILYCINITVMPEF